MNNAYAGIESLLESGASAYKMFVEARHWAVFLAGGVLVSFWKYSPNMKPAKFKAVANARAFLIYTTAAFCISLILYEYRALILIVLIFMHEIFEYAYEFFVEIFEYIID